MKAAVFCALALVWVLTPTASAVAPTQSGSSPAPAKPSSFAPRPVPHDRTYGVPIQPRIFKSHPKRKAHKPTEPPPQ